MRFSAHYFKSIMRFLKLAKTQKSKTPLQVTILMKLTSSRMFQSRQNWFLLFHIKMLLDIQAQIPGFSSLHKTQSQLFLALQRLK